MMVLSNCQCRDILLIWIIVQQTPNVPANMGDPANHKSLRRKARASPKVIYVVYIAIMFAKYDEQLKRICILTFYFPLQ